MKNGLLISASLIVGLLFIVNPFAIFGQAVTTSNPLANAFVTMTAYTSCAQTYSGCLTPVTNLNLPTISCTTDSTGTCTTGTVTYTPGTCSGGATFGVIYKITVATLSVQGLELGYPNGACGTSLAGFSFSSASGNTLNQITFQVLGLYSCPDPLYNVLISPASSTPQCYYAGFPNAASCFSFPCNLPVNLPSTLELASVEPNCTYLVPVSLLCAAESSVFSGGCGAPSCFINVLFTIAITSTTTSSSSTSTTSTTTTSTTTSTTTTIGGGCQQLSCPTTGGWNLYIGAAFMLFGGFLFIRGRRH